LPSEKSSAKSWVPEAGPVEAGVDVPAAWSASNFAESAFRSDRKSGEAAWLCSAAAILALRSAISALSCWSFAPLHGEYWGVVVAESETAAGMARLSASSTDPANKVARHEARKLRFREVLMTPMPKCLQIRYLAPGNNVRVEPRVATWAPRVYHRKAGL